MNRLKKFTSFVLVFVMLCSLFIATAGTSAALQPYCKGDVTGDGQITTKDVLEIQKSIANMLAFTQQQEDAAEVTGDGKISISDVLKIQKYIAKMIDTLEPEALTKARWIDMLVQACGIANADEASDPYYEDVPQEHLYYTPVQAAAAFGVLPDEGMLYPDNAATREYAAYTAVHALGFYDNGYTLSCADAAQVTYKPEAFIALQLSLLSLQDGSFHPDGVLTLAQAQEVLSAAERIKQGEQIDPDYNSTVTYQSGVLQLDASDIVSYGENTVTLAAGSPQLQAGDVFVEPESQLARQVVRVQTQNGQTVVQTQQPDFTQIADSFDVQQTAYGDVEEAQPLEEGVEISYEQAVEKKVNSAKAQESSGTGISQKLVVSLANYPIGEGVNASFRIEIPTPQVDFKFKGQITGDSLYIEDMYVALQQEANVVMEVAASTEHTAPLGTNIKLLRVPVPLGYGFFVNVDFGLKATLEGKLALTTSIAETAGVRIVHNMPATVHDLKSSIQAEINASVKAGVEAGLVFSFLKFDIMDFTLFSGAAAELSVLGKISEYAQLCGDAVVYAFAELSLGDKSLCGQLLGITYKVELMNKDNSILRFGTHWEDGQFIPECTRNDATRPTAPEVPTQPPLPDLGTPSALQESEFTVYSNSETWADPDPKEGAVTVEESCTKQNIIIPETVQVPKYDQAGEQVGLVSVPVTRVSIYSPHVLAVTLPKTLFMYAESDNPLSGSVSLTENVVSVTFAPGTEKIGEIASYSGGHGVRQVQLPDSVTEIGDNAFCGTALETLALPSSVQKIGSNAFSDCTYLRELELPAGVQIGAMAFSGCESLREVVVPQGAVLGYRSFYMSGLETVTVEKDVTFGTDGYSSSAFEDNKYLYEAVFEDGAKEIGARAFYSCPLLTKVTLADSIAEAGEGAFAFCASLKSVTIPKGLNKISERMFMDSGLTSVVIPSNITEIGANAFDSCDMTTVTVEEGLRVLDEGALRLTALAQRITLPASLQEIRTDGYIQTVCANTVVIKSPNVKIEQGAVGAIWAQEIYAPGGSTAEQYAKRNGIEFHTL